jgi:hypothetical protein
MQNKLQEKYASNMQENMHEICTGRKTCTSICRNICREKCKKICKKICKKTCKKICKRIYDKYDEVVVGSTHFAYFRNICTPQCPHLADDNELELEILHVPRLWQCFNRAMLPHRQVTGPSRCLRVMLWHCFNRPYEVQRA